MQDKNIYLKNLYEKFHKRIFDFLYKYTNNQDTASDLMQETFYSFFKSYGESDFPEEKALMLLYTIARNHSINYSRKFSTIREKTDYIDIHSSKATSFERKEELKEMEEKLFDCLSLLPEDQKTAVLLKAMEDLTLSQIAECMETSVSTVSRLVVKGTAKLLELAKKKGISPLE